jgi:hypothetical protein
MKHGDNCKRNWNDGSSYEGQFCEDKITGYGEFKYEDGSVYLGQLRDGLKHGRGDIDYPNGDTYNGGKLGSLILGEFGL